MASSQGIPDAATADNDAGEMPKPSDDSQSFFFINSTGWSPSQTSFAQKTVRSQAARASASSRIETTAARRQARRRLAPATRPSPPSRPSSTGSGLPSTPPDTASDWTCNLASIVRQSITRRSQLILVLLLTTRVSSALDVAIAETRNLQPQCDVALLDRLMSDPALRHQCLVWDCVALVVNHVAESARRRKLSRSILVWQRHNLLTAIRDAVRTNGRPEQSIVLVVALLAGWELIHGETQAGNIHAKALPGLLQEMQYATTEESLSLEVDLFRAPIPSIVIADGFSFYKQQGLLPALLMDMAGSIASVDLATSEGPVLIRQYAAATAAFRPSSSHREGKELYSVAIKHVMIATGMLTTLLLATTDNTAVEDSVVEGLDLWHMESLVLASNTLVGTVYDEILLWTMVVFLCVPAQASAKQVEVLEMLRETLEMRQLDELILTVQRYICTAGLIQRMTYTLGHMFSS